MTGNHLMLLLFRSLRSLSCRDSRWVQQGCFIGNTIDIRFYRLSFLVGRIRICPIPAYNECMASERSSKFYYVCILLDPVVDIYQRRSIFWLGTLHKRGHVYPAMIRLDLQLEIRSVGSSYCACFVSTLWISVEYILPWKKNSSSDRPCLNKALLSSLTELCNLCKCLCHS